MLHVCYISAVRFQSNSTHESKMFKLSQMTNSCLGFSFRLRGHASAYLGDGDLDLHGFARGGVISAADNRVL
jgi:hypothetical protein